MTGKRLITSWGYEELDDLIGPIAAGRLYVVGARPSNGKSTLLLNVLNMLFSRQPVEPRKVLCYWTEVSTEVAYTLWAALRLGVSEDDVLMERWDRLPPETEAAVNVLKMRLGWEQESGDDGEYIRFAKATRPSQERLLADVEKYKPDVVIFDYIQKVKPLPGQDRFHAIADVAGALQTMAVEAKCAVIVGSQLKRKGDAVFDKYRAPDLEDMKGAGEIEESADVVLGLFRLLQAGMTKKDEDAVRAGERALADFAMRNAMAIRILKHRYRGSAADELIRLRIEGKRIYGRYTTREGVGVLPERGDAYEVDRELLSA